MKIGVNEDLVPMHKYFFYKKMLKYVIPMHCQGIHVIELFESWYIVCYQILFRKNNRGRGELLMDFVIFRPM